MTHRGTRFLAHALFILCTTVTPLTANEAFNIFDEKEEFWDIVDDYVAPTNNAAPDLSALRDVPANDIVTFLVNPPIEIIDLLQEDFYLRTNSLRTRSVLDMPAFEPATCMYNTCWTLGVHPFWVQMNRSRLTKDSTNLGDYIGITQQTLLDKLRRRQEILGEIDDFKQILDIDLQKLFSLFETMTIQERRIGFMFHLRHQWDCFHLRILVPWYYREKNYFICKQLQEEAEAEFARQLGPSDATLCEQQAFENDHFISDRLGFGDTRVELDRILIERKNYTLRGGLQFTIPTAFSFQKGLRGTTFCARGSFPLFSFNELFCILTEGGSTAEKQEAALALLKPLFLGALDQLSANLLENSLGNHHHGGVGIFIRSETCFARLLELFPPLQRLFFWLANAYWRSRLSLEYTTPGIEKRFFVTKNDPTAFTQRDFTDAAQAEDNLAFLERELINKFYAVALPCKVYPGIIFRSTSKFCYCLNHWDGYIGTDTWIQTKESFSIQHVCPEFQAKLDCKKAKSFLAYQSRFMAGLIYHLERPTREWHLGVHVDTTFAHSGIGKDRTVAFTVEANF